jgi:hypothetical protein
VEDLFRGYPHFLNYLAASILYGLMVAIGLILLILSCIKVPILWVSDSRQRHGPHQGSQGKRQNY